MIYQHNSDIEPVSKEYLKSFVEHLELFMTESGLGKYDLAEVLLQKLKKENYEALVNDLFEAMRHTQDEEYFEIFEKLSELISLLNCDDDFKLYLKIIPMSFFFGCDEAIFTHILKKDVAETVNVGGKIYTTEEFVELSKNVIYINETMMTFSQRRKAFREIAEDTNKTVTECYNNIYCR